MGGAWLTTHLWEHYLFTGDKAFLAGAYPIFKGACEFFLDVLVEEPKHHWLITCPSVSPEHGGVVAGPTMDMEILRDLFASSSYESLQRSLGRAELLAEYASFFGDPSLIDKDVQAYLDVTAADVQRAAAKLLTKSGATIVDVVPQEAEKPKQTAQQQQ